MFDKILVATDFSEASKGALSWGEYLANKMGASLIILHVVQDLNISVADASSLELFKKLEENQMEKAKKQLEKMVSGLQAKKIKASFEITSGSPHSEILRTASRRKADLIVLGTRGLSGMERLFLGSVAARVVRGTKIPVMVVRTKKQPTMKKILVPTDTSKLSFIGVDFGIKWAESMGVQKVDVVYCFENLGVQIPGKVRKVLESEIKRKIEKRLKLSTVETEVHVVQGDDPSDGIVEFAKSHKSSMIVMASHGRSGMGRILLGSTAEKVMRKTTVPVLVVKKNR